MTKITIKKIRKLNAWIKSDEQARKIIKTYHSEPKGSLDKLIIETEQQRVKRLGQY